MLRRGQQVYRIVFVETVEEWTIYSLLDCLVLCRLTMWTAVVNQCA